MNEKSRSPRRDLDDLFEWHARFAQSVAFKSFIDNVSNVLTDGFFRIIKNENFQGIETDTMDSSRAALVQGRLSAAVSGNLTKENESFCIKISNIVSSLRNCHAQHFIQLSKPKNSTNIVLRVFEPEVHNFSPIFSKALSGVIDPCDCVLSI